LAELACWRATGRAQWSPGEPPVLDQVAVRMGNLATRSIWRLKALPYTALTLVLSKLHYFSQSRSHRDWGR
jgi:hypothetical protein